MADIIKDSDLVKSLESKINQVKSEIAKVIVGQDQVVEELIISLFAKGHCLLIGVPGLAKTLLVKTISEAMDFYQILILWCCIDMFYIQEVYIMLTMI